MSTGVALVTSDWNTSGGLNFTKTDGTLLGTVNPTGASFKPLAGASSRIYVGGIAPHTTTTGTDTTPANGRIFICEVQIPYDVTLTGVSYLIGSVGGTDKVVVALFDAGGAVLASSAVDSSVTVGTTATFQRVPFTATYAARAGKYFVGVQMNGTTARVRTQVFGDHDTTTVDQTFNTLVAITPPTTFTASKGPISMLY